MLMFKNVLYAIGNRYMFMHLYTLVVGVLTKLLILPCSQLKKIKDQLS